MKAKMEWKLYLKIWGVTHWLLKAEENISKKFRQKLHVLVQGDDKYNNIHKKAIDKGDWEN